MQIRVGISASVAVIGFWVAPLAFRSNLTPKNERQILFAIWAPQKGKQPDGR